MRHGSANADARLPPLPAPMTAPRRTFAIISHPDAGKTTLTEKLLLDAGAIGEAGAVKARAGRQRDATSDWMEMERERGISITSTVLQFEHRGHIFNLLDTPGHRDFSRTTYRVLSAVDAAIIVIDAAKGIEAQTLKLFEVARTRGVPLITFVNKCDRPALAPLELLDDIETQLGLTTTPVTWPIGMGPEFVGVIDRRDGALWKMERTAHGAKQASEVRMDAEDLTAQGEVGATAAHEVELLDGRLAQRMTRNPFWPGRPPPCSSGRHCGTSESVSFSTQWSTSPPPRRLVLISQAIRYALDDDFTGFVFKVQANLDPRHRDRIAYLRVCSGVFERGAQLVNHRTGRAFAAKYAHQLFGRDRDTVDLAYPGDIVGLINAGDLTIGDTLSPKGDVHFHRSPPLLPNTSSRRTTEILRVTSSFVAVWNSSMRRASFRCSATRTGSINSRFSPRCAAAV